jgi:hypothetical protein
MSKEHWKDQPRAPAGSEDGGQWTEGPDHGKPLHVGDKVRKGVDLQLRAGDKLLASVRSTLTDEVSEISSSSKYIASRRPIIKYRVGIPGRSAFYERKLKQAMESAMDAIPRAPRR